jgi:hypothetical protein
MNRNNALALGATIAAVVIVPGLANGLLSQAGYSLIGSAIWALGYGFGVIGIWYVWIRPLDITGPAGTRGGDEPDEQ